MSPKRSQSHLFSSTTRRRQAHKPGVFMPAPNSTRSISGDSEPSRNNFRPDPGKRRGGSCIHASTSCPQLHPFHFWGFGTFEKQFSTPLTQENEGNRKKNFRKPMFAFQQKQKKFLSFASPITQPVALTLFEERRVRLLSIFVGQSLYLFEVRPLSSNGFEKNTCVFFARLPRGG